MLESYGIFLILGLIVIAALLTMKHWGDVVYSATKNWQLISFVTVMCFLGTVLVIKQEQLKYELVYYYSTGSKFEDDQDTRYKIRQCKNFITAKMNGEQVIEARPVKAGFINVAQINNWDYCAKTFGLNYWKHDTSINGQDGGRVLCEAYARDTYRSGKVQTWCDTVFAPAPERDQKI